MRNRSKSAVLLRNKSPPILDMAVLLLSEELLIRGGVLFGGIMLDG